MMTPFACGNARKVSSTPAASDTGLQTQTHYTTTVGTGSGITAGIASNYNNTRTFVFRTTLGSLNGNYSEVGVGWATGSNMFSRALILDGGGSPTTISVSSVQQLDIVYQLSMYPPIVDTSTTPTISGVSYTVTGRASRVTTTDAVGWAVSGTSIATLSTNFVTNSSVYTGAIGAITTGPAGSSSSASSATNNAYSNNSKQLTGSLNYDLTSGNVSGGIKSAVAGWNGFASFQYEFNPVIPKDGTKTLVMNYSVNWARR